MIDKATFLRSIKAKPNDYGLQLVFADWLEEQGEADEAAAIRGCAQVGPCTDSTPGEKFKPPEYIFKSYWYECESCEGSGTCLAVRADKSVETWGMGHCSCCGPCDESKPDKTIPYEEAIGAENRTWRPFESDEMRSVWGAVFRFFGLGWLE